MTRYLKLSGQHDVFVLATALERIRDEYLYRSEDPTEPTGAPFLEWAATAEDLRLQILEGESTEEGPGTP